MKYLFISISTAASLMAHNASWHIHLKPAAYSYADGKTVYVADSAWIDSLELTGWNDILVKYPIGLNDSNKVHIVYLNNSELK